MDEEIEFYRETEFKDTKIGKLPEEWEVRTLGEIGELSRGLSYRGHEKFAEEVSGSYLFLTLNSIKEGGGLRENGWSWIRTDRLRERHFVREGDIVIANTDIGMQRGHILGAPAIVYFPSWYRKDRAIYSHHISKLQLKTKLHPQFFFYYLSYVQPMARKYYTGTGVWGLDIDAWSNELSISLPPLAEQRKISEILSTVDESIQKTDDIIAKTERLKKGLIQELLKRGIGHKEFKDTEIGKIPKEWEVMVAADVADYINGYPFSPTDWKMHGIPIIRIQNLNDPNAEFNYFDGKIDDIYKIKNGDLLFSWSASIGIHIWKGGDAVLNQHIFKVVPKANINKLFLYYDLLLAIEQLKSRVHGSTMKHFQKNELKTTFIPIPPLEEQQKIAEILSTVDEKLETLKLEKAKLGRIKQWFMGELLSGRIRVRVA